MSLSEGSILIGERRSIDKTGLEKISQRVFFSSYQAAVNGAYAAVGSTYSNALFVGASAQGDEAGNWICQFDYEKVVSQSDENPADDIGLVEELDFSMSQNPVQSSPNFKAMTETYLWDTALKAFSQNLSNGDPSPVFGTTDFLSYTCVYRQTQTLAELPDDIFSNLGTIITDPPFKKLTDPAMNDDRTWLYLAPKISTRGNAFQVVQEWMLSGAGGWLEAIYGSTALKVLETSKN
jgi:hypothetical protein